MPPRLSEDGIVKKKQTIKQATAALTDAPSGVELLDAIANTRSWLRLLDALYEQFIINGPCCDVDNPQYNGVEHDLMLDVIRGMESELTALVDRYDRAVMPDIEAESLAMQHEATGAR